MEHARGTKEDYVLVPSEGDSAKAASAGPNRATREQALNLAVNLVNHNSFHTPGKVDLDFAEVFAQYLHDGSRDPK